MLWGRCFKKEEATQEAEGRKKEDENDGEGECSMRCVCENGE